MLRLLIAVFVTLPLFPLAAHEFWIAPEQYQVQTGADIKAHLRNGEKFEGQSLSYLADRLTRFDTDFDSKTVPVVARLGDRPAYQQQAPMVDGLLVIAVETKPSVVSYEKWEKFARFAKHKGFDNIQKRHADRSLPSENFSEQYTRHAKSLLAVGDGLGADRKLGMQTEFVALSNPYDPGFANPFRVMLLYNGQPRSGAQVEIFEKAPDGTVTIKTTLTDAAGRAEIVVKPGREYLLDAVMLRAPLPFGNAAKGEPVWQTLWAAMTFAVPK